MCVSKREERGYKPDPCVYVQLEISFTDWSHIDQECQLILGQHRPMIWQNLNLLYQSIQTSILPYNVYALYINFNYVKCRTKHCQGANFAISPGLEKNILLILLNKRAKFAKFTPNRICRIFPYAVWYTALEFCESSKETYLQRNRKRMTTIDEQTLNATVFISNTPQWWM